MDLFIKKHKIYLYKEDFENFRNLLEETISFVFKERGEEVISEKHQKDYSPELLNSESFKNS